MSAIRSTDKQNGDGTSKYDPLKHLDLYIDAGKRIVGLNGKVPAETGWPKVPYRPRDQIPIVHWIRKNFNFGWVLDDNDFVMDVDRHPDGADGWESLTRLIDDLYIHPLDEITPAVVKTGGRGHHLYFSKPKEMQIRKTIPEYPGIDFCSKGQQVVAVGAIHPESGRTYSFGKPFGAKQLMNLPRAPDALLALLSESKPGQGNNSLHAAVDYRERERVIAALSHIDPDIEYPEWIRVLLALHSMQDDDIYLQIADDWSSLGGKYEATGPNSVANKWNTFDKIR